MPVEAPGRRPESDRFDAGRRAIDRHTVDRNAGAQTHPCAQAQTGPSPERALAQLRRIQRHSVSINDAAPVCGISCGPQKCRPSSVASCRRRVGSEQHALWHDEAMALLSQIVIRLIEDVLRWLVLLFRSDESVQVENLFLRRQLAQYIERGAQPGRSMPRRESAWPYWRLFNWRSALVLVQPATIVRWRGAGWSLLWRRKSRPGRPPIPRELRALIRQMGEENPLWGEERIANC